MFLSSVSILDNKKIPGIEARIIHKLSYSYHHIVRYLAVPWPVESKDVIICFDVYYNYLVMFCLSYMFYIYCKLYLYILRFEGI